MKVRKRRRMLQSISEELKRLTLFTEELQSLRESERHLREELAAERLKGEEAEAKFNAKLKEITKARNKARNQRDALQTQLESIQSSQSFRIGHAIVVVARFPLNALRALGRAPRRLLNRGRAAPQLKKGGGAEGEKKKKERPALPAPRGLTIPEGRETLGPLNEGHVTTMFLVWGYSPDQLDQLVGEVASLQMMQRDFKPLFVTDSDSWTPFQERGYWFEYIPPAEEWMDHNSESEWSAFVAERIGSIVETYSPDRIVVYEESGKREALKRGVLNGVVSGSQISVEEPVQQAKGGNNSGKAPSLSQRAQSSPPS